MPNAVENPNADPNSPGTAPDGGQANAGQANGQSGDGGGDEYSNLSQADLIKKLKDTDAEKNNLRSMNDKRFNDMSDKFSRFVDAIEDKEKQEQLTKQAETQGSTRENWNKMFKDDPMGAILLLNKAHDSARGTETDETLIEVKRKHLADKHMNSLKEPAVLKHKSEVIAIMNELKMGHDNPESVKIAWDIWKGRNAQSFLEEGGSGRVSGDENNYASIHDQGGAYRGSEDGADNEVLSDQDKIYVKAAVERGVFKDVGDFKKFSKDMATMKRGGRYGGVIVD